MSRNILECLAAAKRLAALIDGILLTDSISSLDFTEVFAASEANARLKTALTKCGYDPPGEKEIGGVGLPRRVHADVLLDKALSALWKAAHLDLRNEVAWAKFRIPNEKSMKELTWAIETLQQQARGDANGEPPPGLDRARFRPGLGYRDCTWNGQRYTFTTTQAACVQVLWEERDKGTLELSQQLLLDKAGAESQQLKDVFKGSDAWNTMIVRGSKSGLYKLADPT